MNLIERVYKFVKKVPDPKVGMQLADRHFGKNHTLVEVIEVSKVDPNIVRYKFITASGTPCKFENSYTTNSWVWLCTDAYKLLD